MLSVSLATGTDCYCRLNVSQFAGSASLDISVIVPTYNRAMQLQNCLDRILDQDYPRDRYEIIVANDAGDVELKIPSQVVLVQLPINSGPGVARNLGAKVARGTLLAFTDDDCLPRSSWLSRLWDQHLQTPTAALGGGIKNALPDNLCASTSQVISDLVYAHYNAVPDRSRFFSSNNLAVPRDAFLNSGGFAPDFRVASEDREFCDRWLHKGGQLVFVPDAVVDHAHDLTFRAFVRQHFGYGRGAHRYHKLRSERGSGHISQDMAFHATLLPNLKHRLSGMSPGTSLQILGLLALWQISNAAGFFYEKVCASEENG